MSLLDAKSNVTQNIAKAQKEIERLDAEESSPSTPKETVAATIETAVESVAAAVETVKESAAAAVTEVTAKVAELTTSEENKENVA